MENVASVWLLFGIGLIALNILSQRFSISRYRILGRVLKIFFDCYFSIFLLLDHLCHKSSLRTRFRVFKLLKDRGEYEAD
jgi:hypothetical protein